MASSDESAVATPDEEGTWDAPGPPRPEGAPGALSPWLFRRVAELELPAPAHAALERAGVVLLGDLAACLLLDHGGGTLL